MTNIKLLRTAVAATLTCSAMSVSAALPANAVLQMGPQTGFCDYGLGTYPDNCTVAAIPDGNYFAMDNDGSGVWEDGERVGIEAGPDGGILLGVDQSAFPSIDATWNFFGNPGNHVQAGTLSVASDDGAGNATINMTGWTVMWGAPQAPIDMGQGADAIVTCGVDCGVGDSFTLDYNAVVPSGGFAGVAYALHLTGTIGAGTPEIPVPAAVWLFGSGLLGLVGVARRRKAA